jgi:hypothetical protein
MAYYVLATSPTKYNWVPVAPQTLGPFPTSDLAVQAANALLNSQIRTGISWNCEIIGNEGCARSPEPGSI